MLVGLTLVDQPGDADLLPDLERTLYAEFELRGAVRRQRGPAAPGEMGSVTDLLTVALAGGGAVSALAAALRVWLAHPRRADLKLSISIPGVEEIKLDARRVDDVEAILRTALDHAAAVRRPAEDERGAAAGS